MNLQTRIIVGIAVVAGFVFFTNSPKNETSGLTFDDIQSIIVETEEGFVKAENEILGEGPAPPPEPNEPTGPDPDVNKCICKGTGKIIQGDGHVSKCPYHGSKDVNTDLCSCGCGKSGCDCQQRQSISGSVSSGSSNVNSGKGILGRLFRRR